MPEHEPIIVATESGFVVTCSCGWAVPYRDRLSVPVREIVTAVGRHREMAENLKYTSPWEKI